MKWFMLLLFALSANVSASIIGGFAPTDGDVDAVDLSGLLAFPDPDAIFAVVAPGVDPNVAMKFVVNPQEVTSGGPVAMPSSQLAFSPHVTLPGFEVNMGGVILPENKFQIAWLSPGDQDWHLADQIIQKGQDSFLLLFNDVGVGPSSLTNPSAALLVSDINPAAAAVPVPGAVWLFGSGLIGMTMVARRKTKQAHGFTA